MYLVILPDQQEENMSQEQQPTDKTGVLNENLLFFVYLSIHSIIFIFEIPECLCNSKFYILLVKFF